MTSRLFIDATQFLTQPAASGIQRTLLALARNWPSDAPTPEIGYIPEGSPLYHVGPLSCLLESAEAVFGGRNASSPLAAVSGEARVPPVSDAETALVARHEIPLLYDGYLLPEPTFLDRVLDTLDLCLDRMGDRCFGLVFDSLPQTHPEFFPGGERGSTSRYFLALRRLQSAAFISERTRSLVEERLRRTPVPNPLTVALGADGFGTEHNPVPDRVRFVAAGTVEPRKHYPAVLAAFDQLWSEGRPFDLQILGAPGWESRELLERLRDEHDQNPRLVWLEHASDGEWRDALRTASGLIYISDSEGYGLPPLEALAFGVPVIVSARLPSLDGLSEHGQVRLRDSTPRALAAAVESLAEPSANARFRESIDVLSLPTWSGAIHRIADWIRATLSGEAPDTTGF